MGRDGEPKLYRVFRQRFASWRRLEPIREFPPLPGRIYSVAISSDGKRMAAGSSLDGRGEVSVYGYEFDTGLPEKIKAINQKVVTARSGEERPSLTSTTKRASSRSPTSRCPRAESMPSRSVPMARFLPLPASDGLVRLINPETGALVKEFAPVTVKTTSMVQNSAVMTIPPKQEEAVETETLPRDTKLVSLEVLPKEIRLSKLICLFTNSCDGKTDNRRNA